jgi:hypothetical protein
MTVHTHKIRKSGRTSNEKLPDISGTMITYAGSVDLEVEITQRQNSEPTLGNFGESVTHGGYTGVLVEASAEIMPQYKLDAAIVWETVFRLSPTGVTV